jgi:hypothetical protein
VPDQTKPLFELRPIDVFAITDGLWIIQHGWGSTFSNHLGPNLQSKGDIDAMYISYGIRIHNRLSTILDSNVYTSNYRMG